MNPEDDINIEEGDFQPEPPAGPSLIERLLSPESLQKMMACGGGLLVLGFVIWLWSIGLFANPVIAAVIIGAATVGAIAVGVGVYMKTPYRLAGTGLTLLGSLALPLNLWFYHAQGLITLQSGHLWIPAAMCCVIYAGVARTLRQSGFVYAIVGGVVMTGLLILAGPVIDQFWTLMPQVTFLAGTGWACIVAARQFPEEPGDFSRENFGRAFVRAGCVVLTCGLALLAGGQVAARVAETFTYLTAPLIATLASQKYWAAGILLASSAGFAVEHALRRSRGLFGTAAGVTAAWGGLTLIDALGLQPTFGHLMILAASVMTVLNVVASRQAASAGEGQGTGNLRGLRAVTGPMAFLLAALACVQFIGQLFVPNGNLLFSPTGWTLVSQLLTAAAAIWSTAFAVDRSNRSDSDVGRAQGALAMLGAAVFTLAVWTVGLAGEWTTIVPFAVTSLTLPVAAASMSCVLAGPGARRICRHLAWASQGTALTLLGALAVTGVVPVAAPHLTACIVLSVAAAVWYMAAASRGAISESSFGHVAAGSAISQALAMAGVDGSYAWPIASAGIGVGLGVAQRLMTRVEREEETSLSSAPALLVLLGNLAGVLLAGNRIVTGQATVGLIGMLAIQLACSAVSGLMAREKEWRMTFRTAAIIITVTLGFSLNGLLDMSLIHRAELASLLGGVVLLVLGHIAWSREGDQRDGGATAALTLGSLLTMMPLAIGLVCYRLADAGSFAGWGLFHEVGAIVAAVSLLAAGLLCRLRSTTISGASLLTVYVVSLVTLVPWPEHLQSASLIMMIGGGLFFGTGVVLSIYRDRLLAIPDKVREGQGVFEVLKWR